MSIEQKSISEQPKKQDKRLFRRVVVHVGLAGLALSSVVSCDFKPSTASFEPIPISTPASEPTFSSKPTEITKEPEYDYSEYWGVKVAFDKKSGLPVKYVLEDGKEVRFDMEQMKKLREEALISGESQIATMILLDNAIQGNKRSYGTESDYSIEHPKITDLPSDVLSEEELGSKGVSIIQAGNITNLFIRRGAFEEGNSLAAFNNTGRKLTILLLDGSIIDPKYLVDPKYTNTVNNIPQENRSVKDRRDFMVKNAGANIDGIRQAIKKLKESNKIVDQSLVELMFEQKKIGYRYKNLMSDEQIRNEYFDPQAQGLYHLFKDNTTIFLSLGGHAFNYITVYITPKGFGRLSSETISGSEGHLSRRQTHPSPQDFIQNPNASADKPFSYPYGPQTPGLVLRHELGHNELERQQKPIYSEYMADTIAMDGIRKAWDKWLTSGYKDNSSYYYVFQLPPEAGGGYILTRKNEHPYKVKPALA